MGAFFSILIPVFNQVGKMDKCVESIVNQTYENFEVIMVDDGSTDDSLNMIKAFADRDKRFKVLIHDKNMSLVAARYTAMEAAEGDYILFVDSDDYVESDMLQILHDTLANDPVDVLRFGFVVEPYGTIRVPFKEMAPFYAFFTGNEIAALWKRAYSKQIVKKTIAAIEPFYCNIGEDTFYSGILLTYAKSYKDIDNAFYHYGNEGMSQKSDGINPDKLFNSLKYAKACEDKLIPFIKENNPTKLDMVIRECEFVSKYMVAIPVIQERDYCSVVDFAILLKKEDEKLYDFVCNRVIPYRVDREINSVPHDQVLPLFMKMMGMKED